MENNGQNNGHQFDPFQLNGDSKVILQTGQIYDMLGNLF